MISRPIVEPSGVSENTPPSGWFRVEYRNLVPGLSSPSCTHHLVCKGEDWSALRQQLAELRQQFDQHREDTGKDAQRLISETMGALQQLDAMRGAMLEAINLRIGLYRKHEDLGKYKPAIEIIAEDKWLSRWNAALAPTSQPSREKP